MKLRTILRAVALAGLASLPAAAVDVPFTPYKDGSATLSTWSGIGRTLTVRAGDSKAWAAHALPDSGRAGVTAARLEVYVKDVVRDGQLRVHLATALGPLENQSRYSEIKAGDSAGAVTLRASEHVQGMVTIPLSAAFLKAVRDGKYQGVVLEGAAGLDAELGALEGSHGALLHLEYPGGDGLSADTVAARLAANHRDLLRGPAGPKGDTGARGPQGDAGAAGGQGVPGNKGDKGDRGPAGDATDLDPIFKLFLDRGQSVLYRFDRFSGLPQITPDSSGHGNPLTLSISGFGKAEVSPGDSIVTFDSTGYASAEDDRSLNPYGAVTLAARVRLTGTKPDTQTILSKAGQYELAVHHNKLRVRFGTVLGAYEWMGDGDVPGGAWTDVQASYDGKAVRLSINGLQTFYRAFPNGPLIQDTSAALFVAARSANVGRFNGSLNDVRILPYAVGVLDSLAGLPGKATRAQLSADSVSGLAALLALKANLNGAVFTGATGVDYTGAAFNENKTLSTHIFRTSGGRSVEYRVDYRGLGLGDGWLAFREDRAGADFMQANMLSTGSGQRVVFPNGKVGIGTAEPGGKLTVYHDDAGVTGAGQSFRGLHVDVNFAGSGNPTLVGIESDVTGSGNADRWTGLFRGGPLGIVREEGDYYRLGGTSGTVNENRRWALGLDSLGYMAFKQEGNGWADEGTRMTLDRGGRVGIGTAKPEANLNVIADGTLDNPGAYPANPLFAIQSNAGDGPATDDGVILARINAARIASTDPNAAKARLFEVANDDTRILSVRGDGKVGVGTANPVNRLHVVNAASSSTAQSKVVAETTAPSQYGESGFVIKNVTGSWEMFMDDDNHDNLPAGSMGFWNGGVRMQLNSNGSVSVPGAFSKGSGTFDIPHPDSLKEAQGMRLRHSFVESPTRGDNIYRWEVESKDGVALIPLADWFDHLNENVQVWVNPKGHFGRAYGELDATGKQLVIRTEADGRYNVLAIGTRKDKVAKAGWDSLGIEYHAPVLDHRK